MAREGEPSWESDLGPGRPGWHVECAAIALNRLGTQIDLNGGGSDLIFPHHECGAAHAEAFTGVHPFARHYTHTGMIGLDGAKMSKSRGNLVFVSKLRAQDVDPNAIRLALLAGHYRSDREWTDELLSAAQERLDRWRAAVALEAGPPAADLVQRLRTHLADDLDSPGALAAVDAWAARGARTPRHRPGGAGAGPGGRRRVAGGVALDPRRRTSSRGGGMISVELARRLREAGLVWKPAPGDRFVIADRDMDAEVFVVSQLTIDVRETPGGPVFLFNGTTEWALDSVAQADAVWLPHEAQMRTALGPAFRRLEPLGDGWVVTVEREGQEVREVDVDAERAYARALLGLLGS